MFREMRRRKQEISREECVRILNSEKRGALAVNGEDGYPYAVPMNFYYDEAEDKIYFHGAKDGHKADAIRNNEKVCFTVWNQGYQKEDWSYYVTSVVVFGNAHYITDEALKLEKAKAFGVKYYPSAEEVDEEIEKDGKRVQMLELSIDHMTGKTVHEK